ncbi:glutaredoxin family protein [Chloroflexota bacterium]
MSLEEYKRHVPGVRSGDVLLYALSTCGWCRKTKALLDDMGVEYDYIYVDQLDGQAKNEAVESIRVWNENVSFPTMVINNSRGIVGYQEQTIREAVTGG